MKVLIVGRPEGGKSAFVRRLRRRTMAQVRDFDAEMMRRNGGLWPAEGSRASTRLAREVMASALVQPDVILAVHALPQAELTAARAAGFKVLEVDDGVSLEALEAQVLAA